MHLPDQLSPTEAADALLSLAGTEGVGIRLSDRIAHLRALVEEHLPSAEARAAEGGMNASRNRAALLTDIADAAADILNLLPIVIARLEKAQAGLAATMEAAAAAEVDVDNAAFTAEHFGKAA